MVDANTITLLGVWVTATIAEIGLLGRLLQRTARVETKLEERTEPVRSPVATDGGEEVGHE